MKNHVQDIGDSKILKVAIDSYHSLDVGAMRAAMPGLPCHFINLHAPLCLSSWTPHNKIAVVKMCHIDFQMGPNEVGG